MKFSRILFIENARKKGRSQDFIDECLKYSDYLEQNQLPVIFSTMHLAKLIGITKLSIDNMIKTRNYSYVRYKIQKKNGGCRLIMTPKRELKSIQKWILKNILNNIPSSEFCFSFKKGLSIVDNAKLHVNKDVILKLDLKDFFYTITEYQVFKLFKKLGYASNMSVDLARLLTADPNFVHHKKNIHYKANNVLPIGSPTSPMISNIICLKLDNKLKQISNFLDISYSRYADDITFSGKLNLLPKIKDIRKIIEKEGFKINYNKVFLKKRNNKLNVTGINVNNGLHVSKKLKIKIKQHLYYCKKFGVIDHLNKIGCKKSNFKQWLLGNICFIKSVENRLGERFLNDFNEINWPL